MLALDRAIAIAPDIPDAWLERGDWKYSLFWDWEGAVPDLEQGAKLSSKDNISYLVRMMRLRAALGHLDESIALGRHAIKLDPNSTANVVMGYHLTALGRYEEAERILTHRARVAPQDEHAHFYLGLGKPLQGNPQESLRHFEDSAHVLRLTGLAAAYHSLGDRKKSDQNLELLQQRYGHMFPANVTEVHAYRGEKDLAFKWLDRSCELHDASIMYLLWNPLLRRLHGDPRFTAILKKVNLPNTPIDPATPTGTPSVRKSGP